MTLFSWNRTPIRLHGSFLLLAGIFVLHALLTGGPMEAAGTLLLGTAVFGSVLLHEMGHAEMARFFGIRTHSITLYPFGGIAALAGEPANPREEALVALAGPAVNFVLAGLGLPLAALGVPGLEFLVGMNLALGLFNLLPAFPMDGGRILRAWWSTRHDRSTATLRALHVARFFAWGFIGLGLFGSVSLVLVGGFLLLVIRGEQHRWRTAAARDTLAQQNMAWQRPNTGHRARNRRLAWEHPVQ